MEHRHAHRAVIARAQPTPNATGLRHLLSSADLDPDGLERILASAAALREQRRAGRLPQPLAGRQVALLFEKPSLRTRVTFDVGVAALGGHPVSLGPDEVGIGRRESATDIGRNLSRWVDAIVLRTFAHRTLLELAQASSVPVVNALTDHEHPCQALADLLTLTDHLGELRGRTLAFIGDGNNVCHSLLLTAVLAGMDVRIATPPSYEPDADVVRHATRLAKNTGGEVTVGNDPRAAVRGSDAVYTDTWTSMGAEAEADLRRLRFADFRVDAALLSEAPAALVMHCLPAHRGEEISDQALDGPQSVVLDQAENRLYTQQALLVDLLT